MSQSPELIKALKMALRENGMTYSKIAQKLNMSEANIKRMFSQQRFYLDTFDKICQLIGMDIIDLAREVASSREMIQQLTEAQEKELVRNSRLLMVCFLVINGVSIREIEEHYKFKQADIIKELVTLDRLRIIELMPNNRVKLIISPNFNWRPRGPIQNYFIQILQSDFLNYSFSGEDEQFIFLSGITSRRLRESFVEKLQLLAQDFNLSNISESTYSFDRRSVTGMLLAIRAWKPSEFEAFIR